MAFWGIELEPSKPFIHRLDKARGRLHISQATLGISHSGNWSAVQCKIGDKGPIVLCTFVPHKVVSCPLDLEFEEEDDVVFEAIGPETVYLYGFYRGNYCCRNAVTNKKLEDGGYPCTNIIRKSDIIVQDAEPEAKRCIENADIFTDEDQSEVYEMKKSRAQESIETTDTEDEENEGSMLETKNKTSLCHNFKMVPLLCIAICILAFYLQF